jgi:hypothetical protein
LGAVAAFVLGRLSIVGDVGDISGVERVIPLFPAPPKDEPAWSNSNSAVSAGQDTDGLVVETPADGAVLGSSFEVSGRADAPGGEVGVTVYDSDGNELFSGSTSVGVDTGAGFGRFSQTVSLSESAVPGSGLLEVAMLNQSDGLTETRRISFVEQDTVPIQVFFSNNELDPDINCSSVFPVTRVVSSKGQVYRLAVESLLDGPSDSEKKSGYLTSIPIAAKLKSVAADAAGTVTTDFDSGLERGVGGSCRVSAIRAQISETLQQFPEVKDVIISVNGRTEDVLQP